MIEEQTGLLGVVLQDLVRGLPPALQHNVAIATASASG